MINFKKMLAAIGLLAVAVPTTLSVVACGQATKNENVKTELKEVLKVQKIDFAASADEAVTAVLEVNGNPTGLSASDLKAENFKAPSYNAEGSVTITVINSGSKYSGFITVTIEKLVKIALSEVLSPDKSLLSDTTEVNVIANVLELNGNPEGLLATDLKFDDFKAPTNDIEGVVTITVVNADSKYTGSVTVKIDKLPSLSKKLAFAKIELQEVLKNRKLVGDITRGNVIEKLLDINKDSGFTAKDLSVKLFNGATEDTYGLAEIIANPESNFTGFVLVLISLH